MVGNGCDVSTKKQKERHLFTGKKAQDQQSHTTNVISPLFLLSPKVDPPPPSGEIAIDWTGDLQTAAHNSKKYYTDNSNTLVCIKCNLC
eukprot:m.229812 g.229812  ORF g.229812 m.229812 type:complete len:89 (+) comp40050_c0_seq18:963-1229(+)